MTLTINIQHYLNLHILIGLILRKTQNQSSSSITNNLTTNNPMLMAFTQLLVINVVNMCAKNWHQLLSVIWILNIPIGLILRKREINLRRQSLTIQQQTHDVCIVVTDKCGQYLCRKLAPTIKRDLNLHIPIGLILRKTPNRFLLSSLTAQQERFLCPWYVSFHLPFSILLILFQTLTPLHFFTSTQPLPNHPSPNHSHNHSPKPLSKPLPFTLQFSPIAHTFVYLVFYPVIALLISPLSLARSFSNSPSCSSCNHPHSFTFAH